MSLKQKKKKLDKSKVKQDATSSSDSDDESEHELSHYIDDRIKLMKQITKILKPKKIKSMAPDCYKKLDTAELNSILLEELLGISNKRLKHIISGQNNLEYSSSEPDDTEEKPIDIISLDDISTDEDLMLIENDTPETTTILEKKSKKKKKVHIKSENKIKKIKKEKPTSPNTSKEPDLMNVLELLELQARARAIRSQLALEAENKMKDKPQTSTKAAKSHTDDNDSDAIILDSPKLNEIVISSSESDTEHIGGIISRIHEKHSKDKHSKLLDKNKKKDNMEVNRKDVEDTSTGGDDIELLKQNEEEKIQSEEDKGNGGGDNDNESYILITDTKNAATYEDIEENQTIKGKTKVASEKDCAQTVRKPNVLLQNTSDNEEEVVVLNVDVEREEIEREISN